jgi:cytochrome P450
LYESLRAHGTFFQGPLGTKVTASHAVSTKLLRSRALGHQGGPSQLAATAPGAGTVHPIHDAFIVMDPPEHTRLRRLVSPGFTPRALERLRPRIERITGELLGRLDGPASFDLIDSFAAPLPIQVICELLGVPYSERGQFARWGALVGPRSTGSPPSARHTSSTAPSATSTASSASWSSCAAASPPTTCSASCWPRRSR